MSGSDPMGLAAELRDAEQRRRGIELPTSRFDGFSWADARAVAKARDALRLEAGDVQIGYKLGWTSAVMRETLGISHPNWGTLWRSQVVPEIIGTGRFIHAKVEPEIVYVAGSDLTGLVKADDVTRSAAGWTIGLEIVDPRFPSFDFDWLDNTADNSSAAGVCTGSQASPSGDPSEWAITFSDGTVTRHGSGAAAMGSPAAAVAWLVEQLALEGSTLRSGDIVYTGGLAAPFDVHPGIRYSVRSDSFDAVSFSVDGGSMPDDERESRCPS